MPHVVADVGMEVESINTITTVSVIKLDFPLVAA